MEWNSSCKEEILGTYREKPRLKRLHCSDILYRGASFCTASPNSTLGGGSHGVVNCEIVEDIGHLVATLFTS